MEVPSNVLFEDYDPDVEDVFGRSEKLAPRCVTVTAEQKADPLRKPKIMLQGILVAEKLPMSVKQIEARMLVEDGKVMDPKPYGFSSLDDLLQACPDYVIHRRKADGTHVYMAKMNEANQDIIQLVQLQSDREERSFLSSRGRGRGAAFRSARGNLAKEPDRNRMTGSAQNFEARSELGAGKTAARVRNLADVLRRSRASIGKAHPDAPGRLIVTLAELQRKFLEIYALPPWGKKMTEKELHQELDKPEFSKILKFWKFRENGDVYVEEVEDSEDTSEDVRPSEAVPKSREVFGARRPIFDLSDDSPDAFSPVTEEQNMLLEDDDNDFFHSGPGFGGSISNQSNVSSVPILLEEEDDDDDFFHSGPGFGGKPPPAPRSQNLSESENQLAELEDLAQRFGANPGAPVSSFPNDDDEEEEGESPYQEVSVSFERNQSAHHTSANITNRSISPKNPVKVLAEFIKCTGSTHFEALPEKDKHIVNFGRNVFKVVTTRPGDVRVRLANPNLDISNLALGDELRDPIEDDLRWMSELSGPPHELQLAKPVMFIPPRGCLMLTEEAIVDDESKIEKMETILSRLMSSNGVEVTRQMTRPGMPAVYLYHEGGQVRYYRVLVLGHAHREGDAMVLLVDHSDQYFVDVRFSDLFVLPREAGFAEYQPNVWFATICGVERMEEREQRVMWKNMNEDNRKRMVYTVFGGEKGNPYVDMIWCVESRLEWLSQIAKNGGATMASDPKASHLKKEASKSLPSRANIEQHLMHFEGLSLSESLLDEEIEASGGSVHMPPDDVFETNTSPFSIDHLDLKATFAKLVAAKNIGAIFAMVPFVRTVLPHVVGAESAEQLMEHMKRTAMEQLGLQIEHP